MKFGSRPASPFLTSLLLCAGLLAAVLTGCQGEDESDRTQAPAAKADRIPEQQFFDYRLIESEKGVRQWVLQSDKMLKYTGDQDVQLVNLTMDFFRRGEHFSVLTADSGQANLDNRNIHAWGNVIVITDDGRKLETEELFFNNETQLIHNDVFDRFTREADVLTGIGLEATPDLEYIEIKQNVEARVVDEEQPESGDR